MSYRVDVAREDGVVGLALPELGLAVEGVDSTAAVAELVVALREYAADWEDHLRNAPNHAANEEIVRLIALSSDEQLANWVRRTGSRLADLPRHELRTAVTIDDLLADERDR